MKEVSVAEAKNHLSELLARVATGEEIAVTRYGKPIARLVSANTTRRAPSQRARVRKSFERLAALRRGVRLDGNLKAIARQGLD